MIYRLLGQITIPEIRYEYGLFYNLTSEIKYISIDNFFNNIYKDSPSSQITIKIKKQNKKNKRIFDDEILYSAGELLRIKDKYGVYDWAIKENKKEDINKNTSNKGTYVHIGQFLFNHVGETVQIILDDVDANKYNGSNDLLYESIYGSEIRE